MFNTLPLSFWTTWVVTPLSGAVIGYFTNALAIRMLFRPYHAVVLSIGSFRWQVPFTPGLFPKEQAVLAQQISQVITDRLLTVDDFAKIAHRLVSPDQLEPMLTHLVQTVLQHHQDPDRVQTFFEQLAGFLCQTLAQLPGLLHHQFEHHPQGLQSWFNQAFDQWVIHPPTLPQEALEPLIGLLLEQLLDPPSLRQLLIQELTEENRQRLSQAIVNQVSGLSGLLLRLVNPQRFLDQLSTFLMDEPDRANALISHLLRDLRVKHYLTQQLTHLNLSRLPIEVVERIKQTLFDALQTMLAQTHEPLGQWLTRPDTQHHVAQLLQRSALKPWPAESLQPFTRQLALLIHQVLRSELSTFVATVLPLMGLEAVIAQKIKTFSPAQLETLILSIAKKELAGIELLGGVLGLLIGLLNAALIQWL